MEAHLKIAGILLIVLACVHIVFPQRFEWKKDLRGLTLINRQMMYVHTFFVFVMVLLMGVLCLLCTDDLVHTRLGRQVSFGLCVFWGLRLFFQFFVYSPKLWRGKLFETTMHVVFALLWVYLTGVFFLVWNSK
jgi:hypothetical protein